MEMWEILICKLKVVVGKGVKKKFLIIFGGYCTYCYKEKKMHVFMRIIRHYIHKKFF